jgi:HEAT repeat protein
MGNAGHASAFDTITRELNTKNQEMRVSAIMALRWIRSHEAESRLLSILEHSNNEADLSAAMNAFLSRPCSENLLKRLLDIHQRSFFASLRKSIMHYLWELHHADFRVVHRLERILWERGSDETEIARGILEEDR